MPIVTGDYLQEHPNSVYVPTTCGIITGRDPRLVMGAGAALAAREKFPWMPAYAAMTILNIGGVAQMGRGLYLYGFVPVYSENDKTPLVGCFQTKLDFRKKADIKVISLSASLLWVYASQHEDLRFQVPFPGIGLGGLREEDVLTYISYQASLDNVFFYKLK